MFYFEVVNGDTVKRTAVFDVGMSESQFSNRLNSLPNMKYSPAITLLTVDINGNPTDI